jgi:hypothetical protein
MLSHIYFLISEHKEVDLSALSLHFRNQVCLYYLLIFVVGILFSFILAREVYCGTDDACDCVTKL